MTQLPTFSDGELYQPSHKNPLIVFCGIDGSGKTTISKEVAKYYDAWWSCEPNARLYKDAVYVATNPYEKALIFAADRSFHCDLLEFALKKQMCVVDRYHYSNIIYQSVLDNVPFTWLYAIQPPNLIKPTLVILCTCNPEFALLRAHDKGETNWTLPQLTELQNSYIDLFLHRTTPYCICDTTHNSINACINYCLEQIEMNTNDKYIKG